MEILYFEEFVVQIQHPDVVSKCGLHRVVAVLDNMEEMGVAKGFFVL